MLGSADQSRTGLQFMNLVFVSSLVPVENPASGFDIANRVVFDALRLLGHRVRVIGYLQPGQSPAYPAETILLGELEVTNSRVGPATQLRWLSTAFWTGLPVSSAKMLSVPAARFEQALKSLQPFDGLILNSVQLPAAFSGIVRRHPYIYVAHNVEYRSALENATAAENGVASLLFRREARHLERLELELANGAASIWTFAEADRFGFGPAAAERAAVLPLVTSVDEPARLHEPVIEHDLGLIGTWSWKPNRTGLDWFLDKVVPHLPANMTIAIGGAFPEPPRVDHAGVRFVGRVPDARSFMQASHAVPLISRAGSGIQLKTIEALELGLPCVATRASLRGIETLPENCVVEDDPEAFARACTRLVTGSRAGIFSRLDGAAFHRVRLASLLDKVESGIAALKAEGAAAAALGSPAEPGTPAASLQAQPWNKSLSGAAS